MDVSRQSNDNMEEQKLPETPFDSTEYFELCLNCHYPLAEGALFCHHCGQKPTNGKVSLKELLHNLFYIWIFLEEKLFRTVRHLVIPGKLTQDFFKGFHVRYVHPVQLFFIMGVLCFWVVDCSSHKAEAVFKNTMDKMQSQYQRAVFVEEFDSLKSDVFYQFRASADAQQALDTLAFKIKNIGQAAAEVKKFAQDSLETVQSSTSPTASWDTAKKQQDTISVAYKLGKTVSAATERALGPSADSAQESDAFIDISWKSGIFPKIKKADLFKLSESSLVDKYDITGFWTRILFGQNLKYMKEGVNLFPYLIGKLFWGIVFLLPALALIFRWIYRHIEDFYVEHLVFLLHYHAFLFLSVSVALFLYRFDHYPVVIYVAQAMLAYNFVYLFLAMKNYYGENYWATLKKYVVIGFSYVILFAVAIVGVLGTGFLLF